MDLHHPPSGPRDKHASTGILMRCIQKRGAWTEPTGIRCSLACLTVRASQISGRVVENRLDEPLHCKLVHQHDIRRIRRPAAKGEARGDQRFCCSWNGCRSIDNSHSSRVRGREQTALGERRRTSLGDHEHPVEESRIGSLLADGEGISVEGLGENFAQHGWQHHGILRQLLPSASFIESLPD